MEKDHPESAHTSTGADIRGEHPGQQFSAVHPRTMMAVLRDHILFLPETRLKMTVPCGGGVTLQGSHSLPPSLPQHGVPVRCPLTCRRLWGGP